jgi:hypothetical protein
MRKTVLSDCVTVQLAASRWIQELLISAKGPYMTRLLSG